MNTRQAEMMTEVLQKRNPGLALLVKQGTPHDFSIDQLEEVQSHICDEFCEVGLREDDEPNDYGLALDDLIGAISHIIYEKQEGD